MQPPAGEAEEPARGTETVLNWLRAELEIREARDRAELLLGEVNHRVAKSLAQVSALTRPQAKRVTDERVRLALPEMQARGVAIAGVHRRLYTSQDTPWMDMAAYLTNAYKYACSGGGEIRVGLLLAIADDGIGWVGAGEPQGTGLGYRIIDAMAATLEATLAHDPQPMGTRVVVQFAG